MLKIHRVDSVALLTATKTENSADNFTEQKCFTTTTTTIKQVCADDKEINKSCHFLWQQPQNSSITAQKDINTTKNW